MSRHQLIIRVNVLCTGGHATSKEESTRCCCVLEEQLGRVVEGGDLLCTQRRLRWVNGGNPGKYLMNVSSCILCTKHVLLFILCEAKSEMEDETGI